MDPIYFEKVAVCYHWVILICLRQAKMITCQARPRGFKKGVTSILYKKN